MAFSIGKGAAVMMRVAMVKVVAAVAVCGAGVFGEIALAGGSTAPTPGKSALRTMTKPQLIEAAKKYAAAITSWDVRYHVVSEQARSLANRGDQSGAFEVIWDGSVHEILALAGVRLELARTVEGNAAKVQNSILTTGGKLTCWLDPDRHEGSVQAHTQVPQTGALMFGGVIANAAVQFRPSQGLLACLDDPDLRLLEERPEINGHQCFVLESRRTTRPHIFASLDEARTWQKDHPGDENDGGVVDDPVKGIRVVTRIFSVAIDPQASFMPVRVLESQGLSMPARNVEVPVEPLNELRIDRLGKADAGLDVPLGASQFHYGQDKTGKCVIRSKARLEVEKVSLNVKPDPAIFTVAFPPGTAVFDQLRRISYVAGDSPEVMKGKLADAAKEKAFYDALLGHAPPELKASRWLVGEPMRLVDIKNREIIVHFWSIHCSPCVAEMADLQHRYGNTLRNEDGPLFISVHSAADAEDIPKVQQFLKEKGITFPVVLDAEDPANTSWGLTNKAYGIYKIPQDAAIDANGRLISVGDYKLAK